MKAVDAAGNPSVVTTYPWTVDVTPPPSPTLTNSPPNVTASTSASFSFTDDEAAVAYLCELDAGGFSSRASPQSYSSLSSGLHEFRLKARDAAGHKSPVALQLDDRPRQSGRDDRSGDPTCGPDEQAWSELRVRVQQARKHVRMPARQQWLLVVREPEELRRPRRRKAQLRRQSD